MIKKIENDLFKFVDAIRRKKHVTQEELSFGVIDVRLYRKYLTAEVKAPIEVILLLVDKLGFRFEVFMREFSKQQYEESENVNLFFNAVVNYNFENAKNIFKTINKDTLIQKENKVMFELTISLLDYYNRKITIETLINKISKLINYPDLLKEETFSTIELYALGILLNSVEKENKDKIASKLESIFSDKDSILYGENVNIINLTLYRLIRHLDEKGDINLATEFSLLGINNCLKASSFYLLDYFYFCLAVCRKKANDVADFEKNIALCYGVVLATQDEQSKAKFKDVLEKECNQNIEIFLSKYYKKKANL
ncbi:hypothetical protein LJC17_04415 [Acholeplasma sp. OttesenSCG-928-E16]|nr:hypothetical protein [Acholeplasma sp. OttesenSCG-928-E16]